MTRNKNVELFRVIIFYESCKMCFLKCFFYNLSLYQNKSVAVIEIRNESEQNVVSYNQLRKSKISPMKKLRTIAIYLFLTFYLRSNYIKVHAEFT